MAPHSPTTLILDLRDRMARIETKLDTHHDAHRIIDKRLDKAEADIAALDDRVASTRTEIATGKASVATAGAIGGGIFAALSFLGDRFWNIFH